MRKLTYLFLIVLLGATAGLCSVYGTFNPIPTGPGVVINVWNGETPTPGNGTTAASQQVELNCTPASGCPFSADGKFSGAPGAFEVDVQVAATDTDTNYQTCASCNITTVDATNNTFHLDGTLVTAKYARLLMRSRTNSVSITATFTGG